MKIISKLNLWRDAIELCIFMFHFSEKYIYIYIVFHGSKKIIYFIVNKHSLSPHNCPEVQWIWCFRSKIVEWMLCRFLLTLPVLYLTLLFLEYRTIPSPDVKYFWIKQFVVFDPVLRLRFAMSLLIYMTTPIYHNQSLKSWSQII